MKISAIARLFFPLITITYTEAINAVPSLSTTRLPNGQEIATKIKGDEYMQWMTTSDDYTVVTGSNGYLYYGVQMANGRVGTTGVRVDLKPPPPGLSKDIRPTSEAFYNDCKGKICEKINMSTGLKTRTGVLLQDRKLDLNSGTVLNLVIPIRFEDHSNRTLPTKEQLSILMNNNGADSAYCPTGSVRDVFRYNSFGKLNLTSVVLDWVNVSGTEAYWANSNSGLTTLTHSLIRQALLRADPLVNFTEFDVNGDSFIDAITFLHSGYGAEWGGSGYTKRMWSHKWELYSGTGAFQSSEGVKVYDYHISPALWATSGSNITRIGVIAHETSHFFGLPDMYDGVDGQGVGSWDLMGNSWGFPGNQWFPPHMSIFSRVAMGWDTVATVESDGYYILSAAEDQNPSYPRGYKITKNFPPGEYLLLENRQKLFFDSRVPTAGIIIYHVDTGANFDDQGYPGQPGWPGNGQHYRVAVLAADGRYDLEKNVNRGDGGDVWTQNTTAITPSTGADPLLGPNFPNTDSYAGGIVSKTHITVTNITLMGGRTMSFQLIIGQDTSNPTPVPVPQTQQPTNAPTSKPSLKPPLRPSRKPSPKPTVTPTQKPTSRPTKIPTTKPTVTPTRKPTSQPTTKPTTCLAAGSSCSAQKQCCSKKCARKQGVLVCW